MTEPKMTLVVLQQHVLGALTAVRLPPADAAAAGVPAGQPDPAAQAAALAAAVGTRLPLFAGPGRVVSVPVSVGLALATVPRVAVVVQEPLSHVFETGAASARQKPPLDVKSVTSMDDGIVITLNQSAPDTIDVWALVDAGTATPSTGTGQIQGGRIAGLVPLAVAGAGSFGVLLLAPGFAAWAGTSTIV